MLATSKWTTIADYDNWLEYKRNIDTHGIGGLDFKFNHGIDPDRFPLLVLTMVDTSLNIIHVFIDKKMCSLGCGEMDGFPETSQQATIPIFEWKEDEELKRLKGR